MPTVIIPRAAPLYFPAAFASIDRIAANGDAALYEKYLARSASAVDPADRYRFLFGLTSFTDPALVRRTMAYALGPEVRSQDTKLVIARLLGNGAATVIVTLIVSFALMYAVKATGTLRLHAEGEIEGLDLSEHGVLAYPEYVLNANDGTPKTMEEAKAYLAKAMPKASPAAGD